MVGAEVRSKNTKSASKGCCAFYFLDSEIDKPLQDALKTKKGSEEALDEVESDNQKMERASTQSSTHQLTHQHINTSTYTSTHQRINTSTQSSTHQLTHQHINTSTHRKV
jgi:hypothetical protein